MAMVRPMVCDVLLLLPTDAADEFLLHRMLAICRRRVCVRRIAGTDDVAEPHIRRYMKNKITRFIVFGVSNRLRRSR